MVIKWANVHVADHSFGLLDNGELPIDSGSWSNGLIKVMDVGALIYTGIDRGYVRLMLDLTTQPPAQVDAGPWDEIVEVSITCDEGSLRIDSFEQGPPDDLPLLSTGGPGSYRVRVHARGRDLKYDMVSNDPIEDYLLIIWPAEASPEVVLRATDRCGASLRASAANDVAWPQPQLTSAEDAEEQRRARARQNVLDAIRQSADNDS